jgi:hypothetical protein
MLMIVPRHRFVAERWRGIGAAHSIGSPTGLPVPLDAQAIVSTASTETAAGRTPAHRWRARGTDPDRDPDARCARYL